jgi:hypothetical protein
VKPQTANDTFAEDFLDGAAAISEFVFGSSDKKTRRKTYHWLEKGAIPAKKAGGKITSTRSAIRAQLTPKAG